MGQTTTLTASDGFKFGAYRADPASKPKGAIVVIQEIFGVNSHIRNICDRLAKEGYIALAPAIFDRIEPNFQSGYSPDEVAVARKFVANPDWPAMLRDTQAAIDAVKDVGPVGIIGFCLGGSIAYAAQAEGPLPPNTRRSDRVRRRRRAYRLTSFRRGGMAPFTDVEAIKESAPTSDLCLSNAQHEVRLR